jgi:ribonuclease HI
VQETDLGMYMLSEVPETPMPFVPESELEHSQVWSMTFDGASSQHGSGAWVVITAPSGMIFPFSPRLEFDCTNNMAEYEAFLFGLRKVRKMGIKLLKVEGDSELIVNQVTMKCEARNQRLKMYRYAVWDEIEYFDAFNISHIDSTYNYKFFLFPLSQCKKGWPLYNLLFCPLLLICTSCVFIKIQRRGRSHHHS